jgi:hypothetical protein
VSIFFDEKKKSKSVRLTPPKLLILRTAIFSGNLNEQFPQLILIIIVGGGWWWIEKIFEPCLSETVGARRSQMEGPYKIEDSRARW